MTMCHKELAAMLKLQTATLELVTPLQNALDPMERFGQSKVDVTLSRNAPDGLDEAREAALPHISLPRTEELSL